MKKNKENKNKYRVRWMKEHIIRLDTLSIKEFTDEIDARVFARSVSFKVWPQSVRLYDPEDQLITKYNRGRELDKMTNQYKEDSYEHARDNKSTTNKEV